MPTLSLQRTDQSSAPTEAQMKLVLAQTLSSPSFYNAPVIVLDFEADENGTSTGRFRDAVKPRVFSFEIAKSGVSFKPFVPGRMDSLTIEVWEDFSEGYTYRIDAATTKKRTGELNCNDTISYNCGKACISLKKNCKSNPKDPVSAARKENAIAATKAYSKATKTAKKEIPPPTEKKTRAKKVKELPPEPQQETPPPVTEKAKKTGLIGKGTHKDTPSSPEEYYEMMTKAGNNITMEEAKETIQSVKDWSEIGYKKVRDKQKKGEFTQDGENIDKFIKSSTPYKGNVYRGMLFDDKEQAMQWLKGNNGILDNQSAHASWSSDLKVAKSFSVDSVELKYGGSTKQPVIIKSVNKTGASCMNLSKYSHESEVIVPKGAQHKIKNITEKDGVITVEVEEISESNTSQKKAKLTQKSTAPSYQGGNLEVSEMSTEDAQKISQKWLASNRKIINNKTEENSAKIPLIEDTNVVIKKLQDQGKKPASNIEINQLKDENGDVQGFFTTDSLASERKGALYVDVLCTNPQNIMNETKGVGKQILYNAVKKSIEKGFNGKIKLTALPNAASFYKAIGFNQMYPDGKSWEINDYELTEESAKAFIDKYEKSLSMK